MAQKYQLQYITQCRRLTVKHWTTLGMRLHKQIGMLFTKRAYHRSFKFGTVKAPKKGKKQWMTQACLEMINKKNLLHAKFVRTRDPNDL